MIQIIDYGAGNILSVTNALQKLEIPCEVIDSPSRIKDSSKILFPGVGAAASAMKNLNKSGFREVLPKLKNPFLGICLGMQLLAEESEEGPTKCLGIVEGKVEKFEDFVRIPEIGWNKVKIESPSDPIFTEIPDQNYFYFVNSYHTSVPQKYILGRTNYGIEFTSVLKKDNFYGVQFHPEKSGEFGVKLLNNFCTLC